MTTVVTNGLGLHNTILGSSRSVSYSGVSWRQLLEEMINETANELQQLVQQGLGQSLAHGLPL